MCVIAHNAFVAMVRRLDFLVIRIKCKLTQTICYNSVWPQK